MNEETYEQYLEKEKYLKLFNQLEKIECIADKLRYDPENSENAEKIFSAVESIKGILREDSPV